MAATPRWGRNILAHARARFLVQPASGPSGSSCLRLGARASGALAFGVLALGLLLAPGAAHAQVGSDRYSSIVVEAGSGKILETANPDAPRHPASLAKLMTLYMTFEALRDRRITLDTAV